MAVYATVDDVRKRYEGTITADQEAFVDQKLDDAEEHIASHIGDIGARIAAGRTTATRVAIVLSNMVARVLRNTSGARSQTVGPYSHTLDQAVSAGKLFLTREDRKLLGLRRGATTLTLNDDALEHPLKRSPWVKDDPCSSRTSRTASP
ncbi:hypothetical protein GCM10012275_52790 [Longimycelium tulufanense]|uniref:Uncharacterized protein n=1 Tax=Longimycelium tulufanense TaxID=907463 RepID=A0A8J3FWA9_9PSEU|nr:Gp19/Gp15/Gp42 family protein [Longimycelium tulufanense]GGM75540.1 hypothetical protein GCM10012275_52790 [Longimycelium tulufanense]